MKFNLSINTPRGSNYEKEVSIVTLRASEGYVGIMANRLPLISSVKIGRFTVREEEGGVERHGVLANGIVQSSKDEVTVIVKDVIWYDKVDKTLLQKELDAQKAKLDSEKSEFKKAKIEEVIMFYELAIEGPQK